MSWTKHKPSLLLCCLYSSDMSRSYDCPVLYFWHLMTSKDFGSSHVFKDTLKKQLQRSSGFQPRHRFSPGPCDSRFLVWCHWGSERDRSGGTWWSSPRPCPSSWPARYPPRYRGFGSHGGLANNQGCYKLQVQEWKIGEISLQNDVKLRFFSLLYHWPIMGWSNPEW